MQCEERLQEIIEDLVYFRDKAERAIRYLEGDDYSYEPVVNFAYDIVDDIDTILEKIELEDQ